VTLQFKVVIFFAVLPFENSLDSFLTLQLARALFVDIISNKEKYDALKVFLSNMAPMAEQQGVHL